ncbi:hypothetical protein [Acetobacter senegalensis]|uniref:hypothetical protein n=1 Tax=Acetobacter senegalensis TaxID=446692 RepID=UPI00128E935F|nr:hypothetical protein [Acetobacter senegalensis]MPQ74554.1 hypothetical protein [Acetobacter senegalensis]
MKKNLNFILEHQYNKKINADDQKIISKLNVNIGTDNENYYDSDASVKIVSSLTMSECFGIPVFPGKSFVLKDKENNFNSKYVVNTPAFPSRVSFSDKEMEINQLRHFNKYEMLHLIFRSIYRAVEDHNEFYDTNIQQIIVNPDLFINFELDINALDVATSIVTVNPDLRQARRIINTAAFDLFPAYDSEIKKYQENIDERFFEPYKAALNTIKSREYQHLDSLQLFKNIYITNEAMREVYLNKINMIDIYESISLIRPNDIGSEIFYIPLPSESGKIFSIECFSSDITKRISVKKIL